MGPAINCLSSAEEATVLRAVLRQRPTLRVDILMTSPAVKPGENFMSDVTRVQVLAHDKTSGEAVDFSLIMKRLPESETRRQTFNCEAAFNNEARFYKRVLPRLSQGAKLPFPTLLHASGHLILQEDLGQQSYIMTDRCQGLDLAHCQLVLRELGKFHALSYSLKNRDPEQFTQLSHSVEEVCVSEKNILLNPSVNNCIDMALSVLTCPEECQELVNRLSEVKGRGFEALSVLMSSPSPLSVLCHGDLWSNNLLFRYDSEDPQTPTEVAFIDLQACRLASPATDLFYFLLSSSRPGVVRHHFHQLLSTYLTSLERHAPQAPQVTMTQLLEDMRRFALLGLVLSLLVMPVVTSQDLQVDLDHVTEDVFAEEDFQDKVASSFLTPGYRRRVNEIFRVLPLLSLI